MYSIFWEGEPTCDGAKDLLSADVPAAQPEEDGGEARRERRRGNGSGQSR